MQNIVPQKLKKGDEIRIVAPSIGIKIIGADCRQIAKERFEAMGLKVTFAKNTIDDNFDLFGTSAIDKRAEDIMDAFKDKNVKAVFTIIGGFNSNQVLPFLDYGVIKSNPKIICGFSDITSLLNGIREKTGLITFYGPHYSTIGMKKGNEYTIDHVKRVLFDGVDEICSSKEWSDDLWFLDQENRSFIKNDGWMVLRSGKAKGVICGGNLGTFVLLNGTPYQPKFAENTILAIEDCNYTKADDEVFLRHFQALAQRDDFTNVKAIIIGRFQKASGMTKDKLEYIVNSIPQIGNIPIIANIDFGHTTPMITLPLGGNCTVEDSKIKVSW